MDDPTNPPPFSRAILTKVPSSEISLEDAALKLDSILIAEFNYARSTAEQAMGDRANLFDRYLLLVGGVFVAGIGAVYQLSQIGARTYLQPTVLGLFGGVSLLGFSFFLSFIRLRQAHLESLRCMNFIKEYYIRHLQIQKPDVEAAFRWREATIPRRERFGSIFFLNCHIVALLGSISLGVTILVASELVQSGNTGNLLQLPTGFLPYLFACAGSCVSLAALVVYFQRATASRKRPGR